MPETFKEAKTFLVNYECDKCGEEVKQTGIALMTNPAQYQHLCEKCGITYTLPAQYPHTRVGIPAQVTEPGKVTEIHEESKQDEKITEQEIDTAE